MNAKHTLGPWFLDTSLHIYGSSEPRPIDGFQGGVTIESQHVCTAKNLSDARLITAAPELLEVAQSILADDMIQYLPVEYINKVKSVIEKATGGN